MSDNPIPREGVPLAGNPVVPSRSQGDQPSIRTGQTPIPPDYEPHGSPAPVDTSETWRPGEVIMSQPPPLPVVNPQKE